MQQTIGGDGSGAYDSPVIYLTVMSNGAMCNHFYDGPSVSETCLVSDKRYVLAFITHRLLGCP